MNKFFQSLLCITLIAALFFSTVTVPASAASCSHYKELLTEGYMWSPTYYLKQDTTLTGDLSIGQGGSARICLNGYKLNTGDYEIIVAPGTWLEICDCTGKGRICLKSTYSTDSAAIRVNAGGTLNFMSGGIELEDTSYYGSDNYGIFNEGGTVTVTGGSFSASISGSGESYRDSTQALVYTKAGTTDIKGGTFSAYVSGTSTSTLRAIGVWGNGGTVNITGGSFQGNNYSSVLQWQRCPFPLLIQGGQVRLGGTPDITGIIGIYTFYGWDGNCIYAKANGLDYTGQNVQLGCVNGSYSSHTPIVYDVTKGVNDTKFVLNSQNSGSGKLNLYTDKLIYDFGSYYCSGGSTGVITKDSTCSETGVKTYSCSVCGSSRTETIYKKSHTSGPAATATTPQICTVCSEVLKPATLYDGEIVMEYEEIEYDGTAKEPKVTLGELVEGVDYEVTYSDNIEAGTAKAIITGIGNYSGTVELEFEITREYRTFTGECGTGVTYTFYEATGQLTISGNGKITSTPWKDEGFANQVKSVYIGSGITSVRRLISTDMPNVESYTVEPGNMQFLSQDGVMYTIRYSNGAKTFASLVAYPQAKKDETYVIPDGVNNTSTYHDDGYSANTPVGYSKNKYLKKIVIPASLPQKPGNPENLEAYEVKAGNTVLKAVDGVLFDIQKEGEGIVRLISVPHCLNTADNEYTVPEGTTEIYISAFAGNRTLEKVTISSSVTKLGQNAFEGCEALETVVIEDGLKSMDDSVFKNCKNLKSVNIPGTLKMVGTSAFNGCSSLTDVTLAEGVGGLNNNAFSNCTSLKEIVLPESLTSIYSAVFASCTSLESVSLSSETRWIGDRCFKNCTNLKKLVIPETAIGLTEFKQSTFEGSGLESIIFPSFVKSIGWDTFKNCSNLESVDLSATAVTIIAGGDFVNCSNLTEVKMPDGLSKIASDAFNNCDTLETLLIPESLTSMKEDSFVDCDNLMLTVYRDSYAHTAAKEYGIPYVIFGAENCPDISGKILAGGNSAVKIELVQDGEVKYTAVPSDVADGGTGTKTQDYFFEAVKPGEYIVKITMSDGKVQEYTVTVGTEDLNQDLILFQTGDIDLDGDVDSDDLTTLARHVAGIVILTDAGALANADATLDGKVNAEDLTRLAQYVAGIITSWK